MWWEWASAVAWFGEASQAALVWPCGAAAVLLVEAFVWHGAIPALRRIFFWLVAFQALVLGCRLTVAARLSLHQHNPTDFLTGAALLNVASWFVAGGAVWLRLRAWPRPSWLESESLAPGKVDRSAQPLLVLPIALAGSALLAIGSAALFVCVVLLSIFAMVDRHGNWSTWVLQGTFALVALICLGLSWQKPSQLRPAVALGNALACIAAGCFFGLYLPAYVGDMTLPAANAAPDRALVQSFRRAAESDDGDRFSLVCAELSRRPPDRKHTFEVAAREFRQRAGQNDSLSAVLERYVARHPRQVPYDDGFGSSMHPPQRIWEAPELAVIRVLFSRRETNEVMAWLVDPQVPFDLKRMVPRDWPSNVSRAPMLAALGRACSEFANARARAPGAPRWLQDQIGCSYAIDDLMPRDLSRLSEQEAFAAAYASAAAGSPAFIAKALPSGSPEMAMAVLRGMRAAMLHDPRRALRLPGATAIDCPTLERLGHTLCADVQRLCRPLSSSDEHQNLEPLAPCIDRLPAEPPAEMLAFVGY